VESIGKSAAPLSVLVAEDNPGDVLLIREALKSERVDHKIVVQADGERMLRYIESIEAGDMPCPDLILLDLNLPKKNGHTLLARLRQSPVCGHIPVVIVTSSDSPNDRRAVAQLGATKYFRKPSDFDEFMRLGALIRELSLKG
jgi:chemotaxis family two-component system response regulator Rcp1